MLENGFIKLHRSLLKWEWYDDINVFKLFIHLLLTVNLYDEKWHGEVVKRGSRITSYPILSKETKLSVRQIRTALNKLKTTGELTVKTTSKYTVVTVNNYDKFQTATDNLTVKRHSDDTVATVERQQREKVKESIKKDKKVERGSETLPNATPTPTLEQVIDFVFENNLRVNPNKFYYYYENKCWKGVNNWKMKLMEWNETERPHQSNFENKTENNVSFDLDKYEQQLRQTPSLDWLD